MAVCLSALGILVWLLGSPAPREPATARNVRALASATTVIPVSDPSARDAAGNLFYGETLHRCLQSLATWVPSEPPSNEKDLQLALYEHLREAGFTVGFEQQLGGRNRVDLTLDDTVAIELKFGRLRANERNRVIGQSTVYAARWLGRGPLLVVCVGAPSDKVAEVARSATVWNRQLAEHVGEANQLPAAVLVLTEVGERRV